MSLRPRTSSAGSGANRELSGTVPSSPMQASDWIQKEGLELESDMRIYPSVDGTTVDVELAHLKGGLVIKYNEKLQCAEVSRFSRENNNTQSRLLSMLQPGHLLVSVNGRTVIEDDFEDILAFLGMLQRGQQPRRLRFLNIQKCSLEIYRQKLALNARTKDSFGFLRTVEYLLAEKSAARAQETLRQQRDLEFVSYLKSIGGVENLKPGGIFRPSRDLKLLVRRGVPIAFRPTVWMHISLASVHRRTFPANYYSALLGRASTAELDANVAEDIEKDVDRTFPEHEYFQNLQGEGISGLRRILRAYALHNPQVGYCQALNFIAGTMLLYLSEEDAFWLFVTVVDTLLPADYYSESMVGMYVDQMVFSKMIELYMPKIHRLVEREQLQLPLVTVKWFMCFFVTTLRHDVALRVWDMFLNEGVKVVFRIGCALIKLSEEHILASKDGGDLFMILRGLGPEVVDADVLLAAAYKSPPDSAWSSSGESGVHVSPRLRTRIQNHGQVPLVLSGLGLAHIGPRASPSATHNPNAPSSPFGGNNTASASPTVAPAAPEFPVSSAPRHGTVGPQMERIGEINASSLRLSRSSHSSSTSKLHVVVPPAAPRSFGSDFRSFKRADIESWRAEFRPELEEKFRRMNEARKEWRLQEAIEAKAREQTDFESSSGLVNAAEQRSECAGEEAGGASSENELADDATSAEVEEEQNEEDDDDDEDSEGGDEDDVIHPDFVDVLGRPACQSSLRIGAATQGASASQTQEQGNGSDMSGLKSGDSIDLLGIVDDGKSTSAIWQWLTARRDVYEVEI